MSQSLISNVLSSLLPVSSPGAAVSGSPETAAFHYSVFPWRQNPLPFGHRMPAKRNTSLKDSFTATSGCEAMAKCEVRSAGAEVKTTDPFVIRNSAFGISLGPEHADTFRRDLDVERHFEKGVLWIY